MCTVDPVISGEGKGELSCWGDSGVGVVIVLLEAETVMHASTQWLK